MNRTLLALAVMAAALGATAARADDCDRQPDYAPQGQTWNQGSYQLQTQQVWVPGQQQQVWVPGNCLRFMHHQRCGPGHYEWVSTPGHYETQQQWVWVTNSYDQYPRQYGRSRHHGRHHGAAPVGF